MTINMQIMEMTAEFHRGAEAKGGAKWPQFLAGSLAGLGAICSGAVMGWTIPSFPVLHGIGTSFHQIKENEESWTALLTSMGTLVGALPAGFLAHILGRKLLLLLLAAVFLLGGILLVTVQSLSWVICTSYFVLGCASGAASIAIPLYNEEISSVNVRGSIGMIYYLNYGIGILLTCVLPHEILRIFNCVLPGIFFIAFIFMPESPVHLIRKGNLEKAKSSLYWLRTSKRHQGYDIDREIDDLINFFDYIRFPDLNTEHVVKRDSEIFCGQRKGNNVLIVFLLMFFRPLSGINILISQKERFFEIYGLSISERMESTTIICFLLFFQIVGMSVVDRVGRRALMITSFASNVICYAILTEYYLLEEQKFDVSFWKWVPLLIFIVFISTFSIGLGPLPWLLMAELLPFETKKWATGLSVSLNWILIFVITNTIRKFSLLFGVAQEFSLFFVLNVLGSMFVLFFLPETRGKSRREMQ